MALHLAAVYFLLLLVLLDGTLDLGTDFLVFLEFGTPGLLLDFQLGSDFLHLVLEVLGEGLALDLLDFEHFLVLEVELVVLLQEVEADLVQQFLLLEGHVHLALYFLYV